MACTSPFACSFQIYFSIWQSRGLSAHCISTLRIVWDITCGARAPSRRFSSVPKTLSRPPILKRKQIFKLIAVMPDISSSLLTVFVCKYIHCKWEHREKKKKNKKSTVQPPGRGSSPSLWLGLPLRPLSSHGGLCSLLPLTRLQILDSRNREGREKSMWVKVVRLA